MSESKNASDFYIGFVFPIWKRKWFVMGFCIVGDSHDLHHDKTTRKDISGVCPNRD